MSKPLFGLRGRVGTSRLVGFIFNCLAAISEWDRSHPGISQEGLTEETGARRFTQRLNQDSASRPGLSPIHHWWRHGSFSVIIQVQMQLSLKHSNGGERLRSIGTTSGNNLRLWGECCGERQYVGHTDLRDSTQKQMPMKTGKQPHRLDFATIMS